MSTAEIDRRLQAGLKRVAEVEGRTVHEVRREAIRRYLADRGPQVLDALRESSPGNDLTDDEAYELAKREVSNARESSG